MYEYNIAQNGGLYNIEVKNQGIYVCTYQSVTSYDMSMIVQSTIHPDSMYSHYNQENLDILNSDLSGHPDLIQLRADFEGRVSMVENQIWDVLKRLEKAEICIKTGLPPEVIQFMDEELDVKQGEEPQESDSDEDFDDYIDDLSF